MAAQHVAEREVVGFEVRGAGGVEAGVGAGGGAAEHAEDFDARVAEHEQLVPEGGVAWGGWGVVV